MRVLPDQVHGPDAMDQFGCTKGPFARGAPDVDSLSVEHQYPSGKAVQGTAEMVKGELVVR